MDMRGWNVKKVVLVIVVAPDDGRLILEREGGKQQRFVAV
jgi:hypothetical protein